MDESRYKREAQFHDEIFASRGRQATERYYSITHSSSKAFYRNYLAATCKNKRVLEFGCGPDSHWERIAIDGGHVTGIDLSPVAVALNSGKQAQTSSVAHFCVMNAELLAFADGSFDLVCGNGILHHLDLHAAHKELARVLSPTGSAIFLEPLGHNPIINLYRTLTPQLRTPDEHPLIVADFDLARKYFTKVEIHYFHLTSLAATAVAGMKGFRTTLQMLEALDRWLFRHVKWLQKHAWAAAIILSNPRKSIDSV